MMRMLGKALLSRTLSERVLILAGAVLPLVLLASAIRTVQELDEMRTLYLRDQAATVAARLETAGDRELADVIETLAVDQPGLLDVAVLPPGVPGPDAGVVDALASGRELFRATPMEIDGQAALRAYIPFHSRAGLRVARIDLAEAAGDFLVLHARHNLLIAGAASLVLAAMFGYAVWSQRRTAALRLRQLELEHLAHLGKMSAVLAHEIRNPLGAMKGFVQLAAERVRPETAVLLEPAVGEIRRLERLVDDLLLYGREAEPRLREIPWNDLAAQVEAQARQLASPAGAAFACEKAGCILTTDPDLLKQALLNLLRNAFEAVSGRPGGTVALRITCASGGDLTLAVEDNGPGMGEQARRRLYEPFFTTKPHGTGLGLATTRKVVEALGGSLSLLSWPGVGTRAEISLPASPHATTARPAAAHAGGGSQGKAQWN